MNSKRPFLSAVLAAAICHGIVNPASAQAYPTRPVHLIVGFAAGGATDIIARLMGQWLSERLGRSFIIDNRPGGGR